MDRSTLVPVRSKSANRTGITKLSFSRCPGVAGQDCRRVKLQVLSSCDRVQCAKTSGVPDCLYQFLKLSQLDVVCVFHRFEPVVGGSSLPIMTLEVEFNPLLEPCFAKDCVEHSDNFCAFFVDSYGVEVIDLDVGRGRIGWLIGPASSGN